MRFSLRGLLVLPVSFVVLSGCHGSDGPTGPSGPPTVTAVNGATLPAAPIGSTVIIEGSNFGSTQGSGQVLFSTGSGTVPAVIASASNWSDAFIVTTVPTGTVTGNVVVQTAGGTSTPVVFTVTSSAAFSPSTVSWTATSLLPVPLSGHATAFAEIRGASTARVVYAIGGVDNGNTLQSSVYYATVGNTGSLGSWATTAALPTAVAFERAVVATPANSKVSAAGYIYALGGVTNGTSGQQASSAIYRATIAADGTVSGWTQAGSLPAPLHSFGAAIFLGNLYIWGGATTNDVPVANVYRSTIDATGGLGAWKAQAALTSARAYFGYGSFGGYLYSFGGNTGTVAPNDASVTSPTTTGEILYAQVDLRTRDIATSGWAVNPVALGKARMKHTAVVAGGNILVTGGLYAGASTGSSEESYAQLNADGSTGSFNGATGANTISSSGGGNVFNQAAVGYVDGLGAFHTAVIGGDDVNTPGTRHRTVFFY